MSSVPVHLAPSFETRLQRGSRMLREATALRAASAPEGDRAAAQRIRRAGAGLCVLALACLAGLAVSAPPAAAYDGRIVSVVISPTPVQTGQDFTVTITAQNTEATPSPYPGGIRWETTANASVMGVQCPSGLLPSPSMGGQCEGTIPASQTLTMILTVSVDAPGTYEDTATIWPTPDATPGDDTLTGSFTAVGAEPLEPEGGGGRPGAGTTPGTSEPTTTAAPQITQLKIAPTRFRAASSGATFRTASSKVPSTGALVTYAADQDSTARFTVSKATSGRSVGGHCVAPAHANRHKPRCVRYVALSGSAAVTADEGTNRLDFTGRWNGHKLAGGGYQLAVTATNPASVASASTRVTFQIV